MTRNRGATRAAEPAAATLLPALAPLERAVQQVEWLHARSGLAPAELATLTESFERLRIVQEKLRRMQRTSR